MTSRKYSPEPGLSVEDAALVVILLDYPPGIAPRGEVTRAIVLVLSAAESALRLEIERFRAAEIARRIVQSPADESSDRAGRRKGKQ